MHRRLEIKVIRKIDEHETIKVDGACSMELYDVYRSTCAGNGWPAFRLQTIGHWMLDSSNTRYGQG